jgi:hypothetical protein
VTLGSPVGGAAVPFAFAQVFRKGDVPAGQGLVLDASPAQVSTISTWDDGSTKHAMVAGLLDLTASASRAVVVAKGSAASGAPLTEASLLAANATASVTYGTYGTVQLAQLIGTAALAGIYNAGPVYAEFQYVASFPSDAGVRAVFYVQLWSNNRYRVRVAVENGVAPLTAANKSGTCAVSIAGVERLNQAVSLYQGQRFDVVAFNGADPQITPGFDVAYLRSTKLVPNYGWRSPSSTALNSLPTSYTPLSRMGYEADMGGTGYAPSIGLLAHWEALFCNTGDARAYNSTIQHGRAAGAYSIFFRDTATKRMPRFADFPTAYVNSESMQLGGNPNRWEFAHHPNMGFLPWLLTGERFFWEVVCANSWAAWVTNSSGGGTGVNRLYVSQTRGRAWRYRTIAACASVGPDNDLVKADRQANIVANLNNWNTNNVVPNTPGTGILGIYDDKESGVAGFQHSIFESLFMVAAHGWSWDIEMKLSAGNLATLQAVRNFSYKVVVGLTGRGPAQGEYSWRRAPGPYRMTIGSTSSSSSLYNTWNEVDQATYGDGLDSSPGLSLLGSYVDEQNDYSFAQGNWGHVITALAYAVDHGAAGASDGWTRLSGASNWTYNTNKYNDWPQYGIVPR